MKITVRNYRAFSDQTPARWELRNDFTAFVGVNNAGKSSLLRLFHEIRPFLLEINEEAMFRAALEVSVGGTFASVADQSEVFCKSNSRDMEVGIALDDVRENEPDALWLSWTRDSRMLSLRFEKARLPQSAVIQWGGTGSWAGGFEFSERESRLRAELHYGKYAEALRDLSKSIYLGPFRNAVNVGGNADYYDLQIGEQFINSWDGMKAGNNRHQNKAALSVQEEIKEIFGLENLEINAAAGNQTLQIIANGEPYQLQEQGAGLAQFIVVLAFVATRRPTFIFIDEPELNLHPSLQIDFLTTLGRYCTRGVAFATHSIGLARTAGQRVYSVRRDSAASPEVRDLPETRNLIEFLGELSLSGYSELGFDRVLLVEGTTEIPAIQSWLRPYQLEHKVILLPLGGSSLINANSGSVLADIKRLTPRVAALIDSERGSEDAALADDRQAFLDNCAALEISAHATSRRALENYLSEDAVRAIKGDAYRALGPFQKRKEVSPVWGKDENWRIAAAMRPEDIEATDVGVFLRDCVAADHDAPTCGP